MHGSRTGSVSDGCFLFNEYLNRRIRVATEGHGKGAGSVSDGYTNFFIGNYPRRRIDFSC